MNERSLLGRRGEDAAAELYMHQGYRVIERNYRCKGGEIDIIATNDRVLVFCEVKTRRTAHWGEPSEAVGFKKQQRIRGLAAGWLRERGPVGLPIRFDVISIVAEDDDLAIEFIPDAF